MLVATYFHESTTKSSVKSYGGWSWNYYLFGYHFFFMLVVSLYMDVELNLKNE